MTSLHRARPGNLAYVTQTTLSVDDAAAVVEALKARFPDIVGPKKDDICYATQNRQDAVKVARAAGGRRDRRRQPEQLELQPAARGGGESRRARVHGRPRGRAAPGMGRRQAPVGVTAGASAPEVLVREVIERLKELGALGVTELTGTSRTSSFRCRRASRARRHAEGAGGRRRAAVPLSTRGCGVCANHATRATNGATASMAASAATTRVPAGFGQRAHERLREVEAAQQREPLPRPARRRARRRATARRAARPSTRASAARGSGASTSSHRNSSSASATPARRCVSARSAIATVRQRRAARWRVNRRRRIRRARSPGPARPAWSARRSPSRCRASA